ncbi:MAG: hypothetical protein WEA10_05475 [Actinomycetota bacterium]
MIPELGAEGLLPEGIHVGTLDEIQDRFGWNLRRLQLIRGIGDIARLLEAAGCARLWIDGSFVTAKNFPGDVDMTWDPAGVDIDALPPALLALDAPRLAQKVLWGADILPNITEAGSGQPFLDFFQQDPDTGGNRGIVLLEMGGAS